MIEMKTYEFTESFPDNGRKGKYNIEPSSLYTNYNKVLKEILCRLE